VSLLQLVALPIAAQCGAPVVALAAAAAKPSQQARAAEQLETAPFCPKTPLEQPGVRVQVQLLSHE
jgi:hypothetical protein